jgi:septin family protein
VIPGETTNTATPSSSPTSTTTSSSSKVSPTTTDDESLTDSRSDSHSMGSPESIKLKPRVVSLNIMVAGLAGLGKTTLTRALLDAWWKEIQEDKGDSDKTKSSGIGRLGLLASSLSSPSPPTTTSGRPRFVPSRSTVSTTAISPSAPFEYYDEKANTILRVRIIDTPGFGNRVNHRNSVKPITDYISNCRRKRFFREQSPSFRASSTSRSNNENDEADADSRLLIHVCLYFLSPGRFLAIDRHFLKHVQDEVTIVPVIAKADTMTDDEIARYRAELTRIWEDESIDVYSLDENEKRNRKRRFAAANHLKTAGGQSNNNNNFYRGRRPGEVLAIISRDGIYPWGHSCALDPEHSDLKMIRDSLLSEHTERFLELATAKYVAYRDARIAQRSRSEALKYVALVGLAAIQLGRMEIKGTKLNEVFSRGLAFVTPFLRRLTPSPKLRLLFARHKNSPLDESGVDNAEAGTDEGGESELKKGNNNNKGFLFGFFGKPSFGSNDVGGASDDEPENTVPETAKSNSKRFPLRFFGKPSSNSVASK